TLTSLTTHLHNIESLRSIKDTTRLFTHLLHQGHHSLLPTLFSTNATLHWGPANAPPTTNDSSTTILHGADAIAQWLSADAGAMSGSPSQPGSLDAIVIENPVISLSATGTAGKGRWNSLRFQGDGGGGVRFRGGIFENEYVLTERGWRISLLRYYGLYEGGGREREAYKEGWRNVNGRGVPVVPYHFTPEGSGVLIPEAAGEDKGVSLGEEELERRIRRLNDEDEVRNLMHAHGYYVDRRMWTDVVDLHTPDSIVILRGEGGGIYTGLAGVRQALERMGPEGLTQGINNDHPIFDIIVEVNENGKEAIARGLEIAMIGDAGKKTARWEFNLFRNQFVKEGGVWKIKVVDITPLMVADYYEGWGYGGLKKPVGYIPPLLNISKPTYTPSRMRKVTATKRTADLSDLARRLSRSLAYDGAENQSHAYGYLLDDINCAAMGALFARRGHKASPFAGFFITPERVAQACFTSYGTNRSALRNSISFHWRPQPVVLVSHDGRSATLRARLLQPSTSTTKPGSFNGAIYHDQMVLEDGKWRLWSVTIDEFYWQSSSWEGGWSAATPRNSSAPNPGGATWTTRYPPDLTIAEVGEREATFRGGSGKYIEWPDIQRMWWQYRNPVSGRVPESYWPGCVPCRVKEDWALERNGYQEPVDWPWL
ncbi:uncharacterized protein EI97DRAFT_363468, partial [Westerdykella ornata]